MPTASKSADHADLVPRWTIDRQVRPLAYALTAIGTIASLVSLVGTSWFSIVGPNIISSSQPRALKAGWDFGYVVSSAVGTHRSWLIWLLFALCMASALVAGLPKPGLPAVARVVAPILAVLLAAIAVFRAILSPHALTNMGPSVLPSGTHVVLHPGLWIALGGFVLIGLGAALGPKQTRIWASGRPQ